MKVRYCPECSYIGEVPETCISCCPTAKPEYIDEEIAKQAKIGFDTIVQAQQLRFAMLIEKEIGK